MRRAIVFLLACVSAPARGAAPHPITIEDLIAFERLSEPVVSPDGHRVVYTVSTLDPEGTKRRSDLWMVELEAGKGAPAAPAPRRFTAHDSAHSAAFSPDGRFVYFLSSRGGASRVWRIALSGGEAEPVTRLPLDVGAFRLSPDGTRLAVGLDVFTDCRDLACTSQRVADAAKRKSTEKIYDHLFIRHWDSWGDGRRSHLFVVPVAGGSAVDVMAGMDADCPSKPFGGEEDFAFTPEGRGLVFSARAGADEAWSTNFDLFEVPIDGSKAPAAITARNLAWDTQPVFSPDGKSLAYLAMRRPGYESDRRHIQLRDRATGAERELAVDLDRSPDELVFSGDGRTIFATADHLGNKALFAVDVRSGAARVVVGTGHATAPRVAGGELVFGWDSLAGPAELYRVRTDGSHLGPITAHNAARLADVKLGKAEPFSFAGWNGETVHAWLVLPVGAEAGHRYPVAFLIHGGPQGSFANTFHYRWNPQIYAGAGYAAVMVDFHGSTGYGQAFTDAIGGDWGGKPLVDLQKGLEAALAHHPQLDGDRACALGASFGGYMINWIAGSWPDRFRCLVNHDGNLDERAAYFDTEELWFPEWEHGGTPWEKPEGYTRHNPVDLVASWKTPMLVIHGGRDYRVVDTQGMSTFTALQRRHIPSRFLYFPDENHWVQKPQNSVLWHHTVIDWLDRYTRQATAAR